MRRKSLMTRLPLVAALLASPLAHALGAEEALLTRLRDSGDYKCTGNNGKDGYVCVSTGGTFVLLPKNLEKHTSSIFYAHGLTGICKPGASGENFLLDQMPTLLKNQAIAVLPVRKDATDVSFPLDTFVAKFEQQLGASGGTWIMAAHSWGGKFVSRELADHPELAKRVTEIFLLDAAYDVDQLMVPFLKKVLAGNPQIKIKAVAMDEKGSATISNTKSLMNSVNNQFPGVMTMQIEGGVHCGAPKYFSAL